MSEQALLDEQRKVIARLVDLAFDEGSNAYTGFIELVDATPDLLSALKELENNVDTQQLLAAEESQQKVDNFNLLVSLDDKVIKPICDLFVNSNSEVSFRTRPAAYPWLKRTGQS
ncbi:MAG: hypothetical protein WAM04_22235 [Candidatus Sulfotelmatobacter sp.]